MTLVFPKGKPQTPQHVLHVLALAHLSSLVLPCFFNTLMQQYSASNYFYLFYFALPASSESPGSAPQPERDKFLSKQCKTLPFGGAEGLPCSFSVPFPRQIEHFTILLCIFYYDISAFNLNFVSWFCLHHDDLNFCAQLNLGKIRFPINTFFFNQICQCFKEK